MRARLGSRVVRALVVGAIVVAGLVAPSRAPAADEPLAGKHSVLFANGLRVVVRGETKRSARTLVLVHGNFDRLETWDRLRPLLEADFRVITLDLPGFGDSPNRRAAYGVDALAAALDDALATAHVGHAVFVGNSLGGAVVSTFASTHPERVDALVLEDANVVSADPTPAMSRAMGALWLAAERAAKPTPIPADLTVAQDFHEALDAALRLALPTPGVVDAALLAHFATAFDAAHWPDLTKHAGAFSLDGLIDRLVAAHTAHPFPVLVLWGVDDPLIPLRAAERLMPRLRGARAVFFAGAGHAPHLERPLELARVLVAAFADAKIALPAEDLMVPAADGTLPDVVSFDLPRVHAARLRALVAERRHTCTTTREAAACAELARMLRAGRGTAPDPKGALLAEQMACKGGDDGACIALRNADATVAERVDRPLRARIRAACAHGDGEACTRAGDLFAAGIGAPANVDDALAVWDSACARGTGSACVRAGETRWRTPPANPMNPEVARLYGRGCQLGAPVGCTHLASFILAGFEPRPDGTSDQARAFELLTKACTADDAEACTMLGGWDRSLAVAASARLFARGCALGDAEACDEAGRRADGGRGVMPDAEAAEALYGRACALRGDAVCAAQDELRGRPERRRARLAEAEAACRSKHDSKAAVYCQLLARDRGVHPDPAAALRIDRARCANDDAEACLGAGLALAPTAHAEAEALLLKASAVPRTAFALARVLLVGAPGLPRDTGRASSLLMLACVGGEGEACVMLEER